MKVIILHSVYACGNGYTPGEVVDLPEKDSKLLIALKKAMKPEDTPPDTVELVKRGPGRRAKGDGD